MVPKSVFEKTKKKKTRGVLFVFNNDLMLPLLFIFYYFFGPQNQPIYIYVCLCL